MASNNVPAQGFRESSETPSLSQVEGSLFVLACEESPSRPSSSSPQQSKEPVTKAESPASTPQQTKIWAPIDNFKASFLNQLGHRFFQLLEEGTLKLDPYTIIWIDENGLPTREGLPALSLEDLERPRPFYFAGENAESYADVSTFEDKIREGRTLWRQPASEEESSPEETPTPSSLFDFVFAELKSMPRITHLAWKDLLGLFEIISTTCSPYSDQITAFHVNKAITREKKDFKNLELLENAFTNLDCMRKMVLWVPCDSIHTLAGIDPKSSDREAELEILDDDLSSNVSEVMRLATLLQLLQTPTDRLVKGAERLAKVASVLRAGEMGSLMSEHIAARGRLVDIELEPCLMPGRKRSLE